MSLDAPEQAEPSVVRTIPRRYVALGLIVIAVILVAVLVVVRDHVNPSNATSDVETFTPAPASVVMAVSHIPTSISSAIGVTSPDNSITAPTPTGNPSLWQSATADGGIRPVVFFYGAEFAPYAAAERWPVVVALSRFGTFNSLGLMQSSGTVAFSGTATFTFWQAQYRSVWVDLQTVERYSALDPTGIGFLPLQKPTARQAASVAVYNTSATTFPLLDIANHYVLVGSSFSPAVLAGLSQAQIVADLAVPASPVTQAIVASANEITAAICTVTGQRPTAVCHERGVVLADAVMRIHEAPRRERGSRTSARACPSWRGGPGRACVRPRSGRPRSRGAP
jgi:hypothetical protein